MNEPGGPMASLHARECWHRRAACKTEPPFVADMESSVRSAYEIISFLSKVDALIRVNSPVKKYLRS